MVRPLALALTLAAGLVAAYAQADKQSLHRELEQDVLLRAMVDELERNVAGLQLEDLDRPYFVEFSIQDGTAAYVAASLGAVVGRNLHRWRSPDTDVRVGSYELDNTNFSGRFAGSGADGFSPGGSVPLEDDYNAIRQAIWWEADREYKAAAEALVRKKAFMESKLIRDKPPDLSREEPVVYFEPRLNVEADLDALQELAVSLSTLFRDYPDVQRSGVQVAYMGANRYLVNSEGTRLRTGEQWVTLSVHAAAQADDGMPLSDSFTVYSGSLDELPPLDELRARCRELADELVAVRNAPVLSGYTGPVLFDAPAATELFASYFGGRFGGGQRPVGSRTSPEDFANKLGKRILPRFIDVVDDPLRKVINGVPVAGHYLYDDEGVPAQPVTLVQGGKLVALLMSRNPSREFTRSNGHGRGRGGRGSVGCLIVTANPALDASSLRQELLDACADEGLEFGMRVARLGGGGYGGNLTFGGDLDFDPGSFGGHGIAPLVMYKVYPDGREELVRGVEIARITLKDFKRILAAGDEPYVYNVGAPEGATYVAPAMLFEELDLAKIDRDFDKPPLLPNPLARTAAD